MKKYVILTLCLLVLVVIYGLVYRGAVITQKKVSIMQIQLEELETKRIELNREVSVLTTPERIETIARTKYNMTEPSRIIIVQEEEVGN